MKSILTKILLSLILVWSGAPKVIATEPEQTLAEVLAHVQKAIGLENKAAVQYWSFSGTTESFGHPADWELIFDSRGRFIEKVGGGLPSMTGFDGKIAWERDWTDVPQQLTLGDLERNLAFGWLMSGGWLFRQQELHLQLAESENEGKVQIDFTFGDYGFAGNIQVDARTWLPSKATYGTEGKMKDIEFSNWQALGKQMAPGMIKGEKTSYEITAASRVKNRSKEFSPQLAAPKGTQFDSKIPADLEVRRAPTGHLLVRPLLNGVDVGWFIFDSGAGVNCIANHVVDKLSLQDIGTIDAMGVGGKTESSLYRGKQFQLGPVSMSAPIFMGLELEFLEPHMGVPIGGVVGYGLLARCVTDLDPINGKIALYNPDTFQLKNGNWADAMIYGRHPCVAGQIEGKPAVFRIDTGAAGKQPVSIHYHTVNNRKMLKGREVTDGAAGGVGGNVKVKEGSLSSLAMAGRTWEEVPTSFVTEAKGAFSDRYTDANIGVNLFDSFRLVLDYPNRRIALADRLEANQN